MGAACGGKPEVSDTPPEPVHGALKKAENTVEGPTDEELVAMAKKAKEEALAGGKMEKKRKPGEPAKQKRTTSHGGILNAFALKFPIILTSFQMIHEKFVHESGDEELAIKRKDLCRVLKDVCRKDFSEKEAAQLLNLTDSSPKNISFREFVIGVSVGFFIPTDSEDEEVQKIKQGFLVIQDAFHAIDKDGGGEIDMEELKAALFSSSNADGDLLEDRFNELDFNKDSSIEFPEFVYAMISWVGFEEEHMERLEQRRSQREKD